MQAWSAKRGLEVPDAALSELDNYTKLLRFWSQRQALIGAGEAPLVVRKHVADALAAAARCPSTGRAADLGSGAGLPGIPIAIARPQLEVSLIESRQKKASFLTVAAQRIPNARVVSGRIEDVAAGQYDVAVARALASLDRLLPLARPVLRPGGLLLAMKSRAYAAELASASPSSAGFAFEKVTEYQLLTGESRALLEFRAE